MTITCFSIDDHARLYHSLKTLHDMIPEVAIDMLYNLNTANIDTIRTVCNRAICESSHDRFVRQIRQRKSYHISLLSLYETLETLESSIYWSHITEDQRDAVKMLRTVMVAVRNRFYRKHGIELDDARTTLRRVCSAMYIPPTEIEREFIFQRLLNQPGI